MVMESSLAAKGKRWKVLPNGSIAAAFCVVPIGAAATDSTVRTPVT
jgi:hypothetical protein